MLKLIGWVIKTTIFAAVILVLGNWIHWKGTTLSDHIKTQMAQVDRHAPIELSKIHLNQLPEAAKNIIRESRIESKKSASTRGQPSTARAHDSRDRISTQDQAQFRALLKELTTRK